MTLFEELTWRGLIHQTTHPELAKLLEKEPFTLYCGFDPTADSLHVGSLLPIIGLMHFQRRGHRPIAVVGGATGMIGDPSGKSQERSLLNAEIIEGYVACIRKQLERFLDFSKRDGAVLVNNFDWLGSMGLVDFLRDVGKHFSVNVMMTRESVRARLQDRDQGISYTEFTYQILQAYDFLHLYDAHGCRLQIGGSDQWGNIVAGMDLTRRLRDGASTFGMTLPLVTKSDGSKFGKSEEGNIWLDAKRTSPYKFYQFWINQTDADVTRYLRLFTFLEEREIVELEKAVLEAPEQRAAQKKLAEEVTRMVHGEDELEKAVRATEALFSGIFEDLDERILLDLALEMATPCYIDPNTPDVGTDTELAEKELVHILHSARFFGSKGEARKLLRSRGIYINGVQVSPDTIVRSLNYLKNHGVVPVRIGKRRVNLVEPMIVLDVRDAWNDKDLAPQILTNVWNYHSEKSFPVELKDRLRPDDPPRIIRDACELKEALCCLAKALDIQVDFRD